MLDLNGIERLCGERREKEMGKLSAWSEYDKSSCHLLPSNGFGVAHIITA